MSLKSLQGANMMKKNSGGQGARNTKKRSFLETTKRIWEEDKNKNLEENKTTHAKETHVDSSDNLVEAEPDINQFLKPK